MLVQMELNIAFFAKVTGDNSTAQHFLQLSESRKKALNSVFWNSDMKQWLDYWLTNSTCQVFRRPSSFLNVTFSYCGISLPSGIFLNYTFKMLIGCASLGRSAAESQCIWFQLCSFMDGTILLR